MIPARAAGCGLAAALFLSGCDADDPATETDDPALEEPTAADDYEMELIDSEGNPVGTATLSDEGDDGVRIAVQVQGLPSGRKGFHLHEEATCDPPDFESAGDHFNPDDMEHGLDNPLGYHAGDMENLEIGEDGGVDAEIIAPRARMDDSEFSVFANGGTALMIHAEEDDQETDPTGDAGDRIACGVISR